MPYKLKKNELAFQVTREGKFEYRRYRHGETYNEVPPEDASKFEKTNIEPVKKGEGAPVRGRADAEKK